MAMMTVRKRAVGGTPWSRATLERASAWSLKKAPVALKAAAAWIAEMIRWMRVRGRHVLGAPGRTRAAHIMQFRPVGMECPGEELAPKAPEFRDRVGPSVAAASRGGKGAWRVGSHGTTR